MNEHPARHVHTTVVTKNHVSHATKSSNSFAHDSCMITLSGKGKESPTLAIVLLTVAQKHFTTSEVAADWHELMIPQRTMRPSITRSPHQQRIGPVVCSK